MRIRFPQGLLFGVAISVILPGVHSALARIEYIIDDQTLTLEIPLNEYGHQMRYNTFQNLSLAFIDKITSNLLEPSIQSYCRATQKACDDKSGDAYKEALGMVKSCHAENRRKIRKNLGRTPFRLVPQHLVPKEELEFAAEDYDLPTPPLDKEFCKAARIGSTGGEMFEQLDQLKANLEGDKTIKSLEKYAGSPLWQDSQWFYDPRYPSAFLIGGKFGQNWISKLLKNTSWASVDIKVLIAFVPMRKDVYDLKSGKQISSHITPSLGLVVIPNTEVGLNATAGDGKAEKTVTGGFIYGPLESASDIDGWSFTFDIAVRIKKIGQLLESMGLSRMRGNVEFGWLNRSKDIGGGKSVNVMNNLLLFSLTPMAAPFQGIDEPMIHLKATAGPGFFYSFDIDSLFKKSHAKLRKDLDGAGEKGFTENLGSVHVRPTMEQFRTLCQDINYGNYQADLCRQLRGEIPAPAPAPVQ